MARSSSVFQPLAGADLYGRTGNIAAYALKGTAHTVPTVKFFFPPGHTLTRRAVIGILEIEEQNRTSERNPREAVAGRTRAYCLPGPPQDGPLEAFWQMVDLSLPRQRDRTFPPTKFHYQIVQLRNLRAPILLSRMRSKRVASLKYL